MSEPEVPATEAKNGPTAYPPRKVLSKKERQAVQEAQRAKKAAASGASKPVASTSKSQAAPQANGSQAPNAAKGASDTKGVRFEAASMPPSSPASTSAFTAVALFAHLDSPKSQTPAHLAIHSQSKATKSAIDKGLVHPAIQRLALQWADFRIVGANARCISMLEAFKEVRGMHIIDSTSF